MSWLGRAKKPKEIDLVLSSSGVRAPCFIGGLEAILEKGYEIKRIAGSSGGAIVAAAYALGMSIDEMKENAHKAPYDEMRDFRFRNLLSLQNPSVYTGNKLDDYYQEIFGDATLSDFRIDCRISVVTILGRDRILLSAQDHPDLPVWEAVRMSSTIPFIFPYLKLNDTPVTDGGLVTGMFDIFPGGERQVVALTPRADHGIRKVVQEVRVSRMFIWNYLKILAEYFVDAADNQHVPQQEWNTTIVIPTFEIGGFHFDLTDKQIDQLISHGYNATMVSDVLH